MSKKTHAATAARCTSIHDLAATAAEIVEEHLWLAAGGNAAAPTAITFRTYCSAVEGEYRPGGRYTI